jgi:uncharacterized 2Fe-2S/4Fe-4S cluster protein (DUF4445 family)
MGKCTRHPQNETPYICMKHQIYQCQECLGCRDSEIYCKFRPSCTIWFLSHQKSDLDGAGEEKRAAAQSGLQIRFNPQGKTVNVPAGSTLVDAARMGDVYINASCNGKGSCGKCKLMVTDGRTENPPTPLLSDTEKEKGYILACQSTVVENATVEIPPEILEQKLKVAGMGQEATERLKGVVEGVDPMLKEIALELSPPTLDDSMSDLDRLNRGLKKEGCDVTRLNVGISVMRQLAEAVRGEDWKLTASIVHRKCSNELLEVRPGNGSAPPFGLAIDLGTTTIVVYLVHMADGKIAAAASGHNLQAECGDDVINRIVCAEKDGVSKLSHMVLETINGLISDVLDSADVDAAQVKNVVVSGNTTMAHLLLQIEPSYIRREPYVPSVSEFPILKAGEIGFHVNPIAAVFTMPGPASYVGGDIVAGVLYTGLHREDPLTLFIDVGTNGEIVLGNREWLMTAACSAGPAFEGGGIRWGMRAEEGAIEKVSIDPETFEPVWSTVGDQPPRGICGSGMIDLISELLNAGIIDRSGRFQSDIDHPRIRTIKDDPVYLLVPAHQTPMKEDIVFCGSDIKNLIYSKGAIYSGFTTLMNEAGIEFSMIDRIIIAGGFGQYLDIEKAVGIGLLPDIDRTKFIYTGNSSIAGAYMALLSGAHRQEALKISNAMTYIDFSSNSRYMDEFTSALFLPHTDLGMFPNVK